MPEGANLSLTFGMMRSDWAVRFLSLKVENERSSKLDLHLVRIKHVVTPCSFVIFSCQYTCMAYRCTFIMPSPGIPKKHRGHAKVVASNSRPSHARDTLSDARKKGPGTTATSCTALPVAVPSFSNAAEAQTGPPLPFLMPRPRNEPPVNPHHPTSGGGLTPT